MTKPKLYCALFSPPARAVILTAKVLKLPLELIPVDFTKKEHLSEEFVKLNPQHTVPLLIDDEEPIWDSHAIITYLVSKYGKNDSLYPKNLLTRARIDQRLHFENGVLFQVIKSFVNTIVYGGKTEYQPETIEMGNKAYDFLEKFLENDFLVGNSMTVADISCIATVCTLQMLIPIESDKWPKVCAWMHRVAHLIPDYVEINEKGSEKLVYRINESMVLNRHK